MLGTYKEIRIQFSCGYTYDEFEQTVKALDSGAVEPRAMIGETISLQSLPGTLEAMRGPHAHCKVLVDPWQ